MILKISRLAPKPVRLRWWQTKAKAARINCTGFACAVEETTLPFTPAIATFNAAQGEFDLVVSGAQAAQLDPSKSYTLRVVLRNGAGIAVDDFSLTAGVE